MAGKHRMHGSVVYKTTVYNGRTYRLASYSKSVLVKPHPAPIVRWALSGLVALAVVLGVFGVVVAPDPVEPALVASTAPDPPSVLVARPADPEAAGSPAITPVPTPEPVVPRSTVTVARPLPVRVYPLVDEPVVDLPRHGKHPREESR